jgi:hypothetical protein
MMNYPSVFTQKMGLPGWQSNTLALKAASGIPRGILLG